MPADLNILVVDDTPDLLQATTRVLRSAGARVHEAVDGQSCLTAVRQHLPDLVLLDVELPDLLGYEICRRIKSDESLKAVYVVMLSSRMTTSDDQSEGLESGADGYITRPLPNRELLARVESIARIIRAERERDRLITQLQQALETIKTLSGMLPICASCKKIRNDTGYWEEVESYVKRHSDAEFTHGICPTCAKKLYGDLYDEEDQ
ncbi:response regulator [bacterium]|nr:response regulator [bacterium]